MYFNCSKRWWKALHLVDLFHRSVGNELQLSAVFWCVLDTHPWHVNKKLGKPFFKWLRFPTYLLLVSKFTSSFLIQPIFVASFRCPEVWLQPPPLLHGFRRCWPKSKNQKRRREFQSGEKLLGGLENIFRERSTRCRFFAQNVCVKNLFPQKFPGNEIEADFFSLSAYFLVILSDFANALCLIL